MRSIIPYLIMVYSIKVIDLEQYTEKIFYFSSALAVVVILLKVYLQIVIVHVVIHQKFLNKKNRLDL